MSARQLRDLLNHVDDTGEVVIMSSRSGDELDNWFVDELVVAWQAAEAEAGYALAAWHQAGTSEAHAVYVAAADRAAAAQDALATAHAAA